MNETVIKIDNLSKQYRLGEVGTGTLSHDLNRWWALARGKEDPYSIVDQTYDISQKTDMDYFWALRDINLEINKGEILGIIGKNGAGKSTLLKLISRITSPTTGSIKTRGCIASLLEIGTGMHPEMTARENIYLNGAILGMKRNEISEKFDEIISFSGCERFVDTPIKRFSSGMKVRLGFAVAAYLEPDILIVDEVLAVGDAEFQKKCIGKMKDVAGHGRTVLFVSHNMAAVQVLCTSAVLLKHGKIGKTGNVDLVIRKYRENNDLSCSVKLSERNDREGSGLVKFTGIRFGIDSKINNLGVVVSGKNLHIILEYTTMPDFNSNNVHFSVEFRDTYDSPLFTCATRHVGFKVNKLMQKGNINLKIDKLPLVVGLYQLDLYCKVDEVKSDYIRSASRFEVTENDIYGTGIIPDKIKHGPFLINYSWIQ